MGRGTTVLALVLVILLVWMSGCADVSFGSQQLGDFGNTEEEKAAVNHFKNVYGDPLTNSGPPRFLEPMVATGLVNNTPVDKVTKFSKDTGSIWFWVFYDNFRKGDPLTLTWTYQGKTIISLERQAGGDFGRAFGEFLRPDSGWATGTHTITISGGGTSAAATFEIVDGRTETVPLPYAEELRRLQPESEQPTQALRDMEGMCFDPSKVPCNGICVDTAGDPENCGACGKQCPSNQVCIYGKCGDSCEPVTGAWLRPAGVELRNCDRHCVDIMSDELNCGGCGMICTVGSTCEAGTCPISQVLCAAIGWTPCNGGCVYTANDPDNCGSCGRACPSTQVCNFYDCRDSCAADPLRFTDCNRHCVDLQSDKENCGACGKKCSAGSSCVSGNCLGPVNPALISPSSLVLMKQPVGQIRRFTDMMGKVVITSPNGNAGPISIGQLVPIRWDMRFSPAHEIVYIDLNEESGKWGGNIAGHIPNTGGFDWDTRIFAIQPGRYYIVMCTVDNVCGKSGVFEFTEVSVFEPFPDVSTASNQFNVI